MLMPSLFEPCGLPQMQAPIYGSLAVAHNTGGLHDTVEHLDWNAGRGNGFVFDTYDSNAHVEEKNRSIGRELFGERRIDRPDLEADLIRLCEEWSDFCNFFRPKKMLIDKVKREDGKGFSCKYDKPKTPYQRLLDEHVLSEKEECALREYRASLHGIDLRHRLIPKFFNTHGFGPPLIFT